MSGNIFGIHWASLENSKYLLLLLPVLILLVVRLWKASQKITKFVHPDNMAKILVNFAQWKRYLKTILIFVASVFLLIALLQPQWDKKDEVVDQEGRDLLIALDISRSMLAEDLQPNRLEFAKAKIKKLLYNLSCERVGLILFAGSTVMQCPLTTDYQAFFMFLNQIDLDTISFGTTAIDEAIKQSVAVFEEVPSKKTKLLFVFTDGEDFSVDLSGVQEKAQKLGISIFTIGVGTEHGAPIPIIGNDGKYAGYEKDEQGGIAMSVLDESVLHDIAHQCGGKYIRATSDSGDVQSLIASISKFEKDSFEKKKVGALQEQYPYFVAIALVSLIVEWIL